MVRETGQSSIPNSLFAQRPRKRSGKLQPGTPETWLAAQQRYTKNSKNYFT